METSVKLKTQNDKIIRICESDIEGVSVRIHDKDAICPNEQRSSAGDSQYDNRLLSNLNHGESTLHRDLRLHDNVRVATMTESGKLIILEVLQPDRAQNKSTEQEGLGCTEGYFEGPKLFDDRVRKSLGLVLHYRDEMKISVKINADRNIALDVPPFETIKYVKRMVHDKEGIPVDKQRLIIAGEVMLDQLSLNEYSIGNGSQLVLSVITQDDMDISVCTTDGTIFKLVANPCDTIGTFKDKIQSVSGFLPHQQRLLYAGNILKDSRLLSDYNIPKESTFQLFIHPKDEMQIYAKFLTGQTLTLKVEPVDTIGDVKAQIMRLNGNSVDMQCVLFMGRELENAYILHDIGIRNDATLYVRLLLGGGYREIFGFLCDEKSFADYNILKEHTVSLILGFKSSGVRIDTTANEMVLSKCHSFPDENIGTVKSRILDNEDVILPDKRHVTILDGQYRRCCGFDYTKGSVHLVLRMSEGMQIRVTTNTDDPIKFEHSNWFFSINSWLLRNMMVIMKLILIF